MRRSDSGYRSEAVLPMVESKQQTVHFITANGNLEKYNESRFVLWE